MSNDVTPPTGVGKVLTKDLAVTLLGKTPDGSDIRQGQWTHVTDDAAEVLSETDGPFYLDCLTSLSPQAAASLSKVSGELSFSGLEDISLDVAKALMEHKGGSVGLVGIRVVSDQLAEVLAQYDGNICLGLAHMSARAAETLLRGRACVEMNVLSDQEGTIAFAFKQKAAYYRPALPWIAGAPEEDGDYFVLTQDAVDMPGYSIELASVWIEGDSWSLKQLSESGEHIDVEHRKLEEIICHYPVPRFGDVPAGGADAYVRQQISKKRLKCLGRDLPITEVSGRLLPAAKKLHTLEVRLTAIVEVLDQIAAMPSLKQLTLLTDGLSAEQCKSLKKFRGDLLICGVDRWPGFRELSDEGAALLAEKPGSLRVALANIPATAAAILRSHPEFSAVDSG